MDLETFSSCLTAEDLPFEEDVARHGHLVKTWLRYIAHVESREAPFRTVVFERALRQLPRSYKLWKMYLDLRIVWVRNLPVTHTGYESVNNAFERCLSVLSKMPVIWHSYCAFLSSQRLISRTRNAFDRALRVLPVTQHDQVWKLYTEFARECPVADTCIKIYRRFLTFAPGQREDFIDYLRDKAYIDEASLQLVHILNDANYRSTKGKTRQQFWLQLCDLISSFPDEIVSLRGSVESIIRSGLNLFEEESGRLWVGLAVHYIGLGLFERARAIYEEAMASVVTIKDFALIWDAYSEFEEGLMQSMIENGSQDEFALQHARYENIVQRRPFLLNSVLLLQNPNNIHEWHARVKLFREKEPMDLVEVLATYKLAIASIDNSQPMLGRPASLWVGYSRFYEEHGQMEDGRDILLAATEYPFRAVEDLASIYCEIAELDVRRGSPADTLELLRNVCVAPPKHTRVERSAPAVDRLFRSTKLWALLADFEESVGTLDGVRHAYNSAITLRVATPQMILNFAAILEEHRFFEDSFQVYEKGVDLFDFPFSMDIWVQYLTKFIARYQGTKIERTRDIFEQALETVPPAQAKILYILYGDFEERYGLARRAMSVYARATRAVDKADQYLMFLLYVSRATEFFGVTRAREVYEDAVKTLEDRHMADICMRYASLERALGEVDRARVVYRYCANFCDPRSTQVFWQTWHNFEVSYGNEETFRDMLRIKRSVTSRFDASTGTINKKLLAEMQEKIAAEERARQEEEARRQRNLEALKAAPGSHVQYQSNADEMDIGSDDSSDEDDNIKVVQQKVPRAVFGTIDVSSTQHDDNDEPAKKKTKRRA